MGRFLLVAKIKNEIRSYVFVDTKDMSFGLELDEAPFHTRVEGDLLFYETKGIFDFDTVHKIIDLKGKTIYEPSVEASIFTSLDSARAYKDQVRELHLDGQTLDLFGLASLSQLEVLEIKKGFGKKIPDMSFKGLEELRVFKIQDCEDLEALPLALTQLPKLNTIFISDCPSLTGIEELIPQLNALKTVRSDYRFDAQKLEVLKANHPNIRFEFLLVAVSEE